MIDRYVEVEVKRISPEAPVPVYKHKSQQDRHGGAYNVYANVKGFFEDAIIISNSPTDIIKTRIVCDEHYLARYDYEPDKVASTIPKDVYDAYIVSDYDKGFVTPELMAELADTGKPIYMGGKRRAYRDVDVLVLNHLENKQINLVPDIAHVIVTNGAGPIIVDHTETYQPSERQCVDPTGAGDVFLAHLACHMINGVILEKAIPLAMEAAGESVEQWGTVVIPPCSSDRPGKNRCQSAE